MAYYGDDLDGDCQYLLVPTGSSSNDQASLCSRPVIQLVLLFCRNLTMLHVLTLTVTKSRLVLEQLCMCGKRTMRHGVRCVRGAPAQISVSVSSMSLNADRMSYTV